VDDADDRVPARQPSTPGRGDQPAALADRVARLSSSASGAERAIRVTVGSSGAVTDLELDDRVQQMTGAELAEEILRVMRHAQAGLTDEVARAVEETIGADTDTGRAVLQDFTARFATQYDGRPPTPVMPSPFPSFETRPVLPHQSSGGSSGGAA
jgi:hypothetical protein